MLDTVKPLLHHVFLKAGQRRVWRAQRVVSRRKKGSKNRFAGKAAVGALSCENRAATQ